MRNEEKNQMKYFYRNQIIYLHIYVLYVVYG